MLNPTLSDRLINTTTANDQENVAIARSPNGNTVIVWESTEQDGDKGGIYAQRFAPDGTAIGSEFQVNTFTNGNQATPAIAMDDVGNFVIIWVDQGRPYRVDGGTSPATITDESGIYGRRFSSNGTPLDSEEFLIDRDDTVFSGTAPGFFSVDIVEPSVDMDANGNFVVAWRFNSDLLGNVFARRFGATGTAQGPAFQVNTITEDRQSKPDVAMDANGNFVVTWVTNDNDIAARRFNAVGTPLGDEFEVNTSTINAQLNPAVAMNDSGAFVITWDGDAVGGAGIFAQRYNPDGSQNGGELIVNTDQTETQPDVALTNEGHMAIAWDEGDGEVYVRTYLASGVTNHATSKISSGTTGSAFESAIALDADGDLVMAWTRSDTDGSGNGIYSQQFNTVFDLSGDDELVGTADADTIRGENGNDRILGLAGNDRLFGNNGNDRLEGGDGNDILDGGKGKNRLFGGDGKDELIGGNQNDVLKGGNDKDVLTGNNGKDSLLGGNGNDQLFGGKGVDRLKGGQGNDLLDGGKGQDILVGGPGRDRFVLTRRQGRDRIQDFRDGQDKIALSGRLGFGQLTITQQGRNTLIEHNTDQLALLKGVNASSLTAADFTII